MTGVLKPRARRTRGNPQVTRGLILDATEQLMLSDGYAAVSTRRVAKALGMTSAAVHYHYPTIDDLFIALHHRMTERNLEQISIARESANPLQALWALQSHWQGSALGIEFVSLANHRKAIRAQIARHSDEARRLQAIALEPMLAQSSLDLKICPPIGLAMLLNAVARALVNEAAVGITSGHTEVGRFVEFILAAISGAAPE